MDNYSINLPELEFVFNNYAEAGRNGYFPERYWTKRNRVIDKFSAVICEKLHPTDRGYSAAFPYQGLFATDYHCVFCYGDTVSSELSRDGNKSSDDVVSDNGLVSGSNCAVSSTGSFSSCNSSIIYNNIPSPSFPPIRSPKKEDNRRISMPDDKLGLLITSPTPSCLIKRKCYVPMNYDALNIPKVIDEAAKEFFNLLHYQRIWQKKNRGEFVHLKKEYLCERLGGWRQWGVLRDYLITNKIIECDNKYKPAFFDQGEGKCLGYRLHERMREAKYHVVVKEHAHKLRKNKYTTQAVVSWIERNLQRLEIGHPTEDELRAIANPYGFQGAEKEKQLVEDYAYQLDSLREVPIIYEIDEFGRRVHTPLTKLKKELRKYIGYAGQHLIELDIKNCQPTMLAILLMEKKIPCSEYLDACEEGLYERIGERLGVSREEAKELTITKYLYGKRPFAAIQRVFQREFPNVDEFIQGVKKKSYKMLAQLLQRKESSLVIYTICDRLRRTNPDLLIATIHDSILCLPTDRELVFQVMLEEFHRKGVLNPKIKENKL